MNIHKMVFRLLILFILTVAAVWIATAAFRWSDNRVQKIKEDLNSFHINKITTSDTDPGFIGDMLRYTDNIVYTKDSRTGMCFAWQYRRMTHVPCEKIPDNLLHVSQPAPQSVPLPPTE